MVDHIDLSGKVDSNFPDQTLKETIPYENKEEKIVLPIIVFSCNRPEVRRSLDGLLKYRPDPEKFPIIVSQDCAHSATAQMIQSYIPQVIHIKVSSYSWLAFFRLFAYLFYFIFITATWPEWAGSSRQGEKI